MSSDIFEHAARSPAVHALFQRLEKGGVLSADNVSVGAQPFLAVLLRKQCPNRTLLVVTDGLKRQESFHQDAQTWLRQLHAKGTATPGSSPAAPSPPAEDGISGLFFFPAWESLPHEGKLPHADVISERLETLVALSYRPVDLTPAPALIVASVQALLQKTYLPADLRARTRTLPKGTRINLLDLVEWLESQGYEPEAQVTQKGEMALRGGILDVYPLSSPWPVRLEFFGDELESLRHFDPQTQISRSEIQHLVLPPGGELGLFRKWLRSIPDSTTSNPPASNPVGPVQVGSLVPHLPADTVVMLCEPELLADQAGYYAHQVPAGDGLSLDWEEFLQECNHRQLTRVEVSESAPRINGYSPGRDQTAASDPGSPPATEDHSPVTASVAAPLKGLHAGWSGDDAGDRGEKLSLGIPSLEAFRPLLNRAPEPQVVETQRREFFGQLHRWLRQDYRVHVFCNNEGERQRFQEIWQEYGLEISSGAPQTASISTRTEDRPAIAPSRRWPRSLHTQLGTLRCGFLDEAAHLVVVTDAEIFGRYRLHRPRRLKSPHAAAMRSALDIDFTHLEEGDYVVHLQHGIGRYLGLQILPGTRTPGDGTTGAAENPGQECLVIEYAPSTPGQSPPRLYVPVTEAHLVSKYIGATKGRPVLHSLGGTRWAKAKAQAAHAVRDLASELLSIQAARASQTGHAFRPDTPWQREFEAAFLYEETPDQWRAIQETKANMEAPRPMDRLICGDVGFGKTEVALRAAFKAVMEGKQVAILVPTTVLAQQHFNTFRERLADYPLRVELLSRFRSRREQQKVIQDLAAGAVDLVIGTHRLIQSDVVFKDLGLVVIDEEQRFGVVQKEKFKRLRLLVDVLTLSATPIPRTLYLALTGAWDMSTIETPPQDRLPVETIVIPYDEDVIRRAIHRELNRQGQVFFLHNRVSTIQTMAERLQQLVPEARLVVGHGQMEGDALETIMTQFVNGEADVLLSTTIIESGLDIPNANTIIIDRADRFGLSDLYQLRGRVGRYKHQAYAYLLLPRHAGLLADARKRLSAIRQYSSLGSGFKIALRDLEIRGAGNLLGPEQSGHITAVGFELYCQLLKQSITALKGQPVKPRIAVQINLDFLSTNPVDDAIAPGSAVSEPVVAPPAVAAQRASRTRKAGSLPGPWEAGSVSSGEPALARAYLPGRYIPDPSHRVEMYRKLAQISELAEADRLRQELRDRFGTLPQPVDWLLQIAELKIVAASRAIKSIETRGDQLRVIQHRDYVTVGGKFPRLRRKLPSARLTEIRKFIGAL